MKYVNSLKYMNCFPNAGKPSDISQKRILELCELLGRVNVGNRVIYLPKGSSAHAAAVMLESVIKHAGYKVGRITSAFGTDPRSSVYIDGERASIEDINRAVAELKAAVLRACGTSYFREETVYVMALLICKMNSCDCLILQGMSDNEADLASVCAPYDLVLAPTFYGSDSTSRAVCDAIRHGVREVISGNQRKSIYDLISRACFSCGARLTFTSKTSFKTESLSSIERAFSYAERSGYRLKSPSEFAGECAMLVIESALAIRRRGVKLPWTSIASGLAAASGTCLFDTLSVSPAAVVDCAENTYETERLSDSFSEIFGKDRDCGVVLCLPASSLYLADSVSFEKTVISVGKEMPDAAKSYDACVISAEDCRAAARELMRAMKEGRDIICLGSVAFASEMRAELTRV